MGTHRQLPRLAAGKDRVTGWGWLIHPESPSFSTSLMLWEQRSPDRVQPEGMSEMYPSESLWLSSCCRQSQGVPQSPCPHQQCWRGKKSGALTEKETLSCRQVLCRACALPRSLRGTSCTEQLCNGGDNNHSLGGAVTTPG